MKVTSFLFFAVISSMLASITSLALAADVSNNDPKGYYSTQHPQSVSSKLKVTLFPPTDITLINATSNTIYAIVPGSPIYDAIYPGSNDHIRHNTMYGDTQIVFQDPYHFNFFNSFVCRLAVVTVFGQVGSYRVNVDTEYCT